MTYQRRAGDPPDGSWLPKAALEEGAWYEGRCRNASIAQWRDGAFHYSRYKFGTRFLEALPHPDDDAGYDVFFPFKKTVRGIERFTVYRRSISERGTHTEHQRNPDGEPQFEGVIWSDGSVTLRWLTACKSTSVWANIEDMLRIHGHPEYGTYFKWHDAAAPKEWLDMQDNYLKRMEATDAADKSTHPDDVADAIRARGNV